MIANSTHKHSRLGFLFFVFLSAILGSINSGRKHRVVIVIRCYRSLCADMEARQN